MPTSRPSKQVVTEAHERVPLRILGYVVLGNHWHFVVWPRRRQDEQVSEFFRWLAVTHAQRWHAHHSTSGMGHVYQGRFKSFPIAADEHLLAVLRYVERNPLRAGLVRRAEEWRWGSLYRRIARDGRRAGPAGRPARAARQDVGRACEPAAVGGGAGGDPPQRGPRAAVWRGSLANESGGPTWSGAHVPLPRAAAETAGRVAGGGLAAAEMTPAAQSLFFPSDPPSFRWSDSICCGPPARHHNL